MRVTSRPPEMALLCGAAAAAKSARDIAVFQFSRGAHTHTQREPFLPSCRVSFIRSLALSLPHRPSASCAHELLVVGWRSLAVAASVCACARLWCSLSLSLSLSPSPVSHELARVCVRAREVRERTNCPRD